MKFCKDCKHIIGKRMVGLEMDPVCGKVTHLNLVTGEQEHFTCLAERITHAEGYCGPEAKMFEPKEAA